MHLDRGYDSGKTRDLLDILGYQAEIAVKGNTGPDPGRQALAGRADPVRREAPCCIPGSAGRDLEGGSWVEWLTWIRKVKGTRACQPTRRPGPVVWDGVSGGPA